MAGLCDGLHVEQLTGVELNPAKHHHSDGVAFFLDYVQDVFSSQGVLSLIRRGKRSDIWEAAIDGTEEMLWTHRSGREQQHAVCRFKSSQADLRLYGVLRTVEENLRYKKWLKKQESL